MSPDELRGLADALWTLMARFTYESDRTPLRDASTFLRQCAEQRPVAWVSYHDGKRPNPAHYSREPVQLYGYQKPKPLYAEPRLPFPPVIRVKVGATADELRVVGVYGDTVYVAATAPQREPVDDEPEEEAKATGEQA